MEKTLEEIKRLLLVAEKFNYDVVCPTRVPRTVEPTPDLQFGIKQLHQKN